MYKDLNKGPYSQGMVFPVVMYEWEKAMATYSSTLAWKIPWTEEPGRLPSMGSQRVGHDLLKTWVVLCFSHKMMLFYYL